jgi:hypothetical protein
MSRRTKERIRAQKEAMRAIWAMWSLAADRPRARSDVHTIIRGLLTAHGIISKEAAIDEHRKVNGLSLKQAMAEVEIYGRRAVKRLQRDGMALVHPVTDYGLIHAATVDAVDDVAVRLCVPGQGSPEQTAGWRIADRTSDPVWLAYVDHRWVAARGAVDRTTRLIDEGAASGILPAASSTPLLPDHLV